MIDALFFAAAIAYAVASALFLAYLTGARQKPTAAGIRALGVALGLHLAHDATRWAVDHVAPFAGIAPAMSTLALMVVLGFLGVRKLRPKLEVVGAFVTPAALVMFLVARAHPQDAPRGGAMFTLHIASNLIGIAAFTVACGMAVAYLLQERQVKARHLGGLFHRLPPLEVLDTYAYHCIAIGLPALTIGVVTGHVVAARSAHPQGLPWQQYFAMISWVLFLAVLVLRVVAGWRGRRAAIGTILGYASAVMVLLFYAVRGASS